MGKSERQTVWKFGSVEAFHKFADSHPEARNSVSPGGAASRLGVGRQRVYNLIGEGRLRAWMVYDCEVGGCFDVPGNRASYVYVSAADVEAYGASPRKVGRPQRAAA